MILIDLEKLESFIRKFLPEISWDSLCHGDICLCDWIKLDTVDGCELKEVVEIEQECKQDDDDDCTISTFAGHIPAIQNIVSFAAAQRQAADDS